MQDRSLEKLVSHMELKGISPNVRPRTVAVTEVAGVTFSDSDSGPVSKFLNPSP